MNDTERYIRQATRGLWGRKRREVAAELRGHIESRRAELLALGLSGPEATRRTLRELGEPTEVRVGMGRVYLLPTMARSGAALGLACALVLAALPNGIAQVVAFDKNPPGLAIIPPYLKVSAVAESFGRAGAGAKVQDGTLVLSLGTPKAGIELPISLGKSRAYGTDRFIRRQDGAYVRSDVLLDALAQGSGLPVTLSGLV